MEELPTIDLNIGGMLEGGVSISPGFLQAIFYISVAFTIIFTIIMLGHWKKYAPNPLRVFGYSIIYLIGAGAMILAQITLLSLY